MGFAELESERKTLIDEIYSAFEGVTRSGGVSWSESEVLDGFGTDEQRRAARLSDEDASWTELARDPIWSPVSSYGGFPFLDPLGFRYYLPAAMIRNLEGGGQHDIDSILTVNKATKPGGYMLREHYIRKWSLFDDRQRRCVVRFICYKIAEYEEQGHADLATPWRTAYERYWRNVE